MRLIVGKKSTEGVLCKFLSINYYYLLLQIRSDCEENNPVTYSISGVGIDRAPYGIFVVNPRTGEINITSIVDREVTPVFVVSTLEFISLFSDGCSLEQEKHKKKNVLIHLFQITAFLPLLLVLK